MKNVQEIPRVQKTINNNPTVMSIATVATGLIRQMAIKPFTPRNRRREFLVKENVSSLHATRNQIFKEKGDGNIPTIVVGGFVPDATEAVEFQRPLLKSYGSIYYINYARNGFSTEMFFAQLADLIEEINQRGQEPGHLRYQLRLRAGDSVPSFEANDVRPQDQGESSWRVLFCAPKTWSAQNGKGERREDAGEQSENGS